MAVYIGDKNITDVVAGNALDSAKQYADQGDANTLQQAKEYTDSEVSQFEADYKQADATVLSEAKQYADQNMIPKSQKGQSGGLAELDETGRVPSSQLPSYVDDVIDVDTYSNLPNPGESGKIYITTDNNKQYRWSGTGYAEISSSLALGETSSTAYRGDRGKVAYDHSQIKSGNPHGTTFASLPDKPTSLPANGGNAESAVKDGKGNVISNTYFTNNQGEINESDILSYSTLNNGTYRVAGTGYYNILAVFKCSKSSVSSLQLYCDYLSDLQFRIALDDNRYTSFKKIWHSGNLNPSDYISFNNTTAYTPTGQYNPATKGYVDSLVGTYILDMDNILDVVVGSSSTVSSSNQTMLEAIRASVIAGNMPRVFGKEVSFDTSILTGISYGVTWQSTIVAPMSSSTTSVLLGLTAIVPSQPQNKMRCVSFIISTSGNIVALSDSGWSSVGGTQEGLNIPASGEQAATGWTYNGKQVYIQRFTGAMQTGSGTTIQYATLSIPGISFIVSRSGTISNSSTNVYQIGDTIWTADGANSIMSTIQPFYSSGQVTLRIYDQNASSNWEYEFWIAYTK